MQRSKALFVGLLAWTAAAGNLAHAATGGAEIPSPGSTTSDGFIVSAVWRVQYRFRALGHVRPSKSEQGLLGAKARDYEITIAADANVTEEVNKQKGQQRAVIQSGDWQWIGRDHDASGVFEHPEVSHWWDAKAGKAMVSFSVNPTKPFNYDDLVKAGDLPNIGTLSCRVPFQTENLTYREAKHGNITLGATGTWQSQLIITRTKQQLEAEIAPGPDYRNWVPTMNGGIGFSVRVVSPPDLPVQWKISLYKTSNLPGVCNNANIEDFPDTSAQWQNQIKKDSYDLVFDFRRYGKTEHSFKPVDEPWQVLETSKPTTGVAFLVNCLDYGASGRVMALAEFEGTVTAATYKETGETFVRIPYATSKDDSHRIAQAAKPSGSEETYDQFSGGKPEADDDDYPEGRATCKGDGLLLFEEYRGFFVRDGFDPNAANVHRRLNPKFKDVFIFIDADAVLPLSSHLADFQKASGLAVHRVGNDNLEQFIDAVQRVVNFNRGDIGHDQHALGLYNFDLAEEGIIGECSPHLGPPLRVNSVSVAVDKVNAIVKRSSSNFRDYLTQVMIHELGHGVGIEHHGISDKFHDPHGEIALEGGQHSGDIECAMRYVGADFFVHNVSVQEPDPKYQRYDKGREHLGLTFCSSAKGTGLNDKSKRLWYCGDADVGNCKAQIEVNDQCAGSGGSAQDRAGSSNNTAPSSPNDPPERSARQSQGRAHVSARLTVSGKRSVVIIPGEAVVFDLRLTGLPNASLDLGKPGESWAKQIALKTLDANGKLVPLSAIVRPIGTPIQTNFDDATGGTPPSEKPAPGQIKIAPKTVYRVALAMDGTETAKLPAGDLRVFAAFDGQPLVSSSVSIRVRKTDELSAEEKVHAESIRTLSEARLAYANERFADAEKLAREVIAKIPNLVEAHLILARSLEKQNKLREAYDAYGRALESEPPPRNPKVEEPPLEIILAMRWLREQLHIEPEPPIAAEPFTSHLLFAESAGGKLTPPFPANPGQLVFEWQLAKASNDPLGIRWIAENVAGVEKNHVIATAKSEANKQAGQFSLTKPKAGFPPGKYRVEIWQTGKMIYSEEFEIKKE